MPRSTSPKPSLSQREFARRLAVSEGTVRGWIAAGLPTLTGNRLDEATARAWVERNLDAHRREARREGTGDTVSKLRARKLEAEARMLELSRRKREGELLERREVEGAVEARARYERDSWLAWTGRTSQALAGALGVDPGQVSAALDRAVRDQLDELAKAP